MLDMTFYKNKKVLITGHTGFKGSWMCQMLLSAGAQVTGYALNPPTEPSLFELCKLGERMNSIEGDVRDLAHLKQVFDEVQPEIVIHMAAQPLVRESYQNPVYTYDVNVMGTVNVLECVRTTGCVKSFVNVTTDKVYKNKEWAWGYRENEELGGYDPYSNSKACSELVTDSFVSAFLQHTDTAVSVARAGNVIGGGDFAKDRIIPDCVRAVERGEQIIVRNPHSTRPYQHVLEPVAAYLMIAAAQYENPLLAGSYNVGPDECDCLTTGDLVTLFCESYQKQTDKELTWTDKYDGGPHEANFLKLDCSKIKKTFGWSPRWHMSEVMDKILEWELVRLQGGDLQAAMQAQIQEYLS